jgi:hypothetical protein
MYRTNPDFVLTVTRDFVRIARRPYSSCPMTSRRIHAVAMEAAMPAPKAEVSIYPWKEPKERIRRCARYVPSSAHIALFLLNECQY